VQKTHSGSDVRYKDIRDTYTLEIRKSINLVLGIILMIPLSFTLFLKNKLQRVVELMGLQPSNTLNRDQPELNKILHYTYDIIFVYSIISHRRFVKFKFYDEYFRTE
jgi:hypothetical protein